MDFEAAYDMFFERFMQSNYRSRDAGMLQFGTIVLDMDDIGETIRGSYIGYGALSKRIVPGDVELEKVGL
jgi:hypothetical protein